MKIRNWLHKFKKACGEKRATVPADWNVHQIPNVCAKSSGIRLQIPILKAIVIACFTIKAKIEKEEKP